MGFASVKFNDCFVVENLKIVQGSKGLFVGMPSQPDGKGGYRDMAYPVTKEFREQLNTAVLQAYEAKLEQMAERGSVGRASISDQLKAGKAAAEQAKAERLRKEKPSRSRALTLAMLARSRKGGGNHATQTTGYDAACYYDGKLLGRCTKADSDAYTLLMNACGGEAARVLREYAYFFPRN